LTEISPLNGRSWLAINSTDTATPVCKDPHRDRGTGAIVAVNNGDRGQRTTGLREQADPEFHAPFR